MNPSRTLLCFALFMILITNLSGPPSFGATETYSKTKKDHITIDVVSPQTNAWILIPSRFNYYIKASYTLQSRDHASITVNVFSLPSQDKRKVLSTTKKITVPRGSSTIIFTSDEIALEKLPAKPEKLLVIISMLDDAGKEMAFSSSVNYLSGNLSVKEKDSTANSNYIQVLSVKPPPGSVLQAGAQNTFKLKLAYDLCDSATGFALLRFSSMQNLNSSQPFREYYIPISRGSGTITAEISTLPLSTIKRGDVLEITIPFYTSASANILSTDRIWPYCITK